MKAWDIIFNIFGVLLLMFWIDIMHEQVRVNEKQFNELRLQYAVDYSTEAGFMETIKGANLGLTYTDLASMRIDPAISIDTFKDVFLMNMDMALTKENKLSLDKYITGASLVSSNGYYVADIAEVNNAGQLYPGGEYEIRWGLKRPIQIDSQRQGGQYVSYNLINEQWTYVQGNGSVKYGQYWDDLPVVGVSRDKIISTLNQDVASAMNKSAVRRSLTYEGGIAETEIYLPFTQTDSGINPITKPSMIIALSGIDFIGTQDLNITSIGGYTVIRKTRVLGYRDADNNKFYAYESQLTGDIENMNVTDIFNTIDEAARAGYNPDFRYIFKPLKRSGN